jgi:hypothetical protein
MVKRFLTASPQEILSMNKQELLTSIKMSEGRIILAVARVRGPNMVDGVSNAELVAAFGADLVCLACYDPRNPYVTGLPNKISREEEDKFLYNHVQIQLGRGWTPGDIRKLIGRPVGVFLTVVSEDLREGLEKHYGHVFFTRENARLVVEQGADFIALYGWRPQDEDLLIKAVQECKDEVGDKVIIMTGRVHGPGLMGHLAARRLITKESIRRLCEAGPDYVAIPAPGTFPGFTVEYASQLVEIIHDYGILAALGIHTSQEGSDIDTIKRIAILAKMAGADVYELGDSGFTESMVPPENIMTLSIAIRGRRHTYRRMAMSPLR